jgi:stress-induced morphogen
MAMSSGDIRKLIESSFPDARVELSSLRDDGEHYMVYVESGLFEGKSRVEQHRMVYEALEGKMGGDLHALIVQTAVKSSEDGS